MVERREDYDFEEARMKLYSAMAIEAQRRGEYVQEVQIHFDEASGEEIKNFILRHRAWRKKSQEARFTVR
jgi:hypothetical protein